MEISSTQQTTSSLSSTEQSAIPTTEISSDFETFLKMLTVQMQNQDPLNPVDSSDYAVQLATFSNVEQQVQTNDILKELKEQLGITGIAQMADWVGKQARAVAPAQLDGTPITIFPSPASGASEVDIVVRNEAGLEMTRFAAPTTDDPIEWAGVTDDGYTFEPGLYTFDVESFDSDVLLETSQAAVYATVSEVQKTPTGDTLVVFEGGSVVPSSDISAIRNDDS
jgi:flagellar basal-body rod modification protein FlgD